MTGPENSPRTHAGSPGGEPLHAPVSPHSANAADVCSALAVDPARGLSSAEVEARLRLFGPNLLRTQRPVSLWTILYNQFASAVVLLLLAALVLAAALGEWQQAIAIGVVLAINAAIGFWTERRAVRSMEALRKIGTRAARVRRNGRPVTVPAGELVPGDIVVVEGGDVISADLRILAAANLASDESALTGESLPVAKKTAPVAEDTVLPDRTSMLFKGTAIARGTGEGVVVATGLATELGRIASLVTEAREQRSPLEIRLEALSRQLIWLTLAIAATISAVGIATDREIVLMVEAAIALAVAAIPEGLPVVATLTLARGMWRMAKRNAVIENLSAVETLGATTVIFTDKTGTLTENRMHVDRVETATGAFAIDHATGLFTRNGQAVDPSGDPTLARALLAGVLCSNAERDAETGEATGDPMEVALLHAAAFAGLERGEQLRLYRETEEHPFDPSVKMMATVHETPDGTLVFIKGAPEEVIRHAARILAPEGSGHLGDAERRHWLERADRAAEEGKRVLALATRADDTAPGGMIYRDLTLIGLVAFQDPPRSDVPEAIAACRRAGIRTVMVTGDHANTALSISRAIGLAGAHDVAVRGSDLAEETDEQARARLRGVNVFARISPEQKLDLIRLFQDGGEVVAMTGDGVNDAPALKKADIGVAMGLRGTDVAREAADMVLRDDAFSTIVSAIAEGRVIFANIRRFAVYLLSCNLGEVLVVGLAVFSGLPLPILPLQILFLNLVTDVFPAFALAASEGEKDVLDRPPRNPTEPILGRPQWRAIVGYGLAMAAATLGSLTGALYWLGHSVAEATTVSFLTLAFAQLWHVFNMREAGAGLILNEVTRNLFVWMALALCTALLLAAVFVPPLAAALKIAEIGWQAWLIALGFSLVPLALGQAGLAIRRANGRRWS